MPLTLFSGGNPPPPQVPIAQPNSEKPWDNVVNNFGWFAFLWALTALVYITTLLFVEFLAIPYYPGLYAFFRTLTVGGISIHLVTSLFRNIPTDERGAGFLFGAGLMELESGMAPIPYGIGELYTVTQKPIRVIVGTVTTDRENKPAEITYDAQGNATIRDTVPRRIKFADGKAAPGAFPVGQDPFPMHPLPEITEDIRRRLLLDPANTVGTTTEPKVIIEMLVVRVIPFRRRVGDLKHLSSKVSEATMAVFQEAAGRIPVGFALENQIVIEARITYAIEELVGEEKFIKRPGRPNKPTVDWGIDFRMTQIQDIGYTHEVNKKIAEATGLAQEGRGLAQKAVGEAEATRLKGFAEADALRATKRAEGEGLVTTKDVIATGEAGLVAAELDAKVRMMQASNTNVIIDGGNNPFTGAAGTLGTLLGNTPGSGQQKPQPGQPRPQQYRGGRAGQQKQQAKNNPPSQGQSAPTTVTTPPPSSNP